MLVELELLLPPLAAGMLVLCSHLPLGTQVLARGIIFIDLAVAQLAALGSLLARQWGAEGLASLLAGLCLAMLGALLMGRWAERFPAQREAIIGLIYAGAAAAVLLLLAADPHAGQQLSRSLNGDILWVNGSQLLPLVLVTLVFLLVWRWRAHWLKGAGFYPGFALMVSLSVPLLGVYLVFVTLIAPALVCRMGRGPVAAVFSALAGYLLGLAAAWWLDWPAGATLVLALLLTSLAAIGLAQGVSGYSGGGGSGRS